jgi:hypothetical protein
LKAGELESFLDGRSRKITIESIHGFIERHRAGSVGKRSDQGQGEPGKGAA